MANNILVIGSMNMDLVVQAPRCPVKGETISGNYFKEIPGGKGANQALAAGRLGGDVGFVGACGKNDFGATLINSLEIGGVCTDHIFRVEENTGVASIIIEEDGDNRIIVVPGANDRLTPDKIKTLEDKIKAAKILLLQLEIPVDTVKLAIDLAQKHQTKVILDPAPAQKLAKDLYQKIDYLLPNQGELDLLLGDYSLTSEEDKVKQLLAWGVGTILVTQGSKGVSLYTKSRRESYSSYQVESVDTTAAGDCFAGAFAVALDQGLAEEEAVDYANSAAALAVTKLGAQSSLPTAAEVAKFKAERGR